MEESIGGGKAGLNVFGSNITLDTFNNRVFKHQVFGLSKRFSLAKTTSATVVIDPTENGPYTKNEFVLLPIYIQAANAGPISIDVYIGTDSDSDGTLWLGGDRNFEDPETPHILARLNPTITSLGTQTPFEFQVPSNGTPAVTTIGGEVQDNLIIIPRKDIRFALVLTNNDTVNAASCVVAFNWFEL